MKFLRSKVVEICAAPYVRKKWVILVLTPKEVKRLKKKFKDAFQKVYGTGKKRKKFKTYVYFWHLETILRGKEKMFLHRIPKEESNE